MPPKVLTVPAPAKLNLFLHIVGRRADGYHLLQTLFRFIDLNDTLHFSLREDGVVRRLNEIDGVPEEQDLCVRAARLLQQECACTLGVDITLEKRIPMGGGLGGGSSDAATTLLALNKLWNLGVSKQRLMELGLTLGADVPVFVFGENGSFKNLITSIGAVCEKGMTYMLHVNPYLMCSPRLKGAFYEAYIIKSFKHTVVCGSIFAMIAFGVCLKQFSETLVATYMCHYCTSIFFKIAPNQRHVFALYGMVKKLFGKVQGGLCCFSKNE